METPIEATVVVSDLARAEDAVKKVERSVSKAFKTYITTPSMDNRKALVAMLDSTLAPGSDADKALNSYRKEFVKANFS